MYVLGIETSCDETSCAVLKDLCILSNVTSSSLKAHKKYGGVIPEIAVRAHLKNIDKVLNTALKRASIELKDIGLIAVTYKPGLIGSLLVGVNFAKALSLSLNKPLIGINHLHAHIFSPFLGRESKLKFPFLGLVISGGHTEIYRVNDFDNIKNMGRTRDDACGEVFDKIAKAYGLGYPGGPAIDKIFDDKLKKDFCFKCGKIGYDLSFSGIKTALIYKKMELKKKGLLNKNIKKSILSSFQYSAVETVIAAIKEAAEKTGIRRVACGGGVTANSYLRRRLDEEGRNNIEFFVSELCYTGDNAAMVAGLGFYLYNKKGFKMSLGLKAEAN